MAMLKRSAVAVAGLLLAAAASPAFAHPHIFVDAEATVTFDENGRVAAIHNRWAFDEAYSAWAVQGLDVDSNGEVSRAELQELADENMMGLADYGYYTFAGEGAGTLPLSRGSNATIDYVDGKTILNFDLTLAQPYAIGQALEIAVSDPEYYVAITFADSSAVSLVNPPTNCSVRLQDGQPVPDALAEQLYALPADVTTLPPNLQQALRGAQGAIVVDCPGGSAPGETSAVAPTTDAAATALEAASALAESPAAEANPDLRPLGGPPPEPGLNLPRTGVLGWLADAQRDFYLAMTSVLGQLKQDWTAF